MPPTAAEAFHTHTYTQTVGHTHSHNQRGTQRDTLGDFPRVGHENRRAAAVDVELSKALGQHFACGLPLPLLLPDCLPLPRPPYAVVMLPSLTELWPRKYKPCRSRSRSRIRSRTTPRPHTHPHRCLRRPHAAYPLAQLAAFLCRSSSLPPSLSPFSLCLPFRLANLAGGAESKQNELAHKGHKIEAPNRTVYNCGTQINLVMLSSSLLLLLPLLQQQLLQLWLRK